MIDPVKLFAPLHVFVPVNKPDRIALEAVVTKAVVATRVVLFPAVCVGAVTIPSKFTLVVALPTRRVPEEL